VIKIKPNFKDFETELDAQIQRHIEYGYKKE